LQSGMAHETCMRGGELALFKFCHDVTKSRVKINVAVEQGHAHVYVGNAEVPSPCEELHTWKFAHGQGGKVRLFTHMRVSP
jgi:hypothetical protein